MFLNQNTYNNYKYFDFDLFTSNILYIKSKVRVQNGDKNSVYI